MTGYILCAAAIFSTYFAAKRGTGYGLIMVFAWGYGYGILRANVASPSSYFLFDAALITLYCSRFSQLIAPYRQRRARALVSWVVLLMIWPLVLVFLPFQPIEISLVGMRASVLVLPAILLGVHLKDYELFDLGRTFAVLDIVVLCFALCEYFWGIEHFYPRNSISEAIYEMHDVANWTAHRIPGTFAQPANYAGVMVASLPFLYGAWTVGIQKRRDQWLIVLGLAAAMLGVLLAASRLGFVGLALGVGFASWSGSIGWKKRLTWFVLLAGIALTASTSERLQRFTTLRDTDYVETRIGGSVNRRFGEIFYEYPMGNGLGGGGTSIPYFWEGHVRNPVALESEYARILLEQSVIGLVFWLSFLVWVFTSSTPFMATPWREGRRLSWFMCLVAFASGMIGIGIFTAVPQGLCVFVMIGWFSVPPNSQAEKRRTVYGGSSGGVLLPHYINDRMPRPFALARIRDSH
jgi:hypothetical protein